VSGFDGTTLTSELRMLIEQYHLGGVIFFARNVEAPRQVAQLTADLQQVAQHTGNPGLLTAIDQEGGRVARLTDESGFSEFPSAMALAATGNVDNARRAAQALAAEMKAVGLNVDFAPVLDVNNNPANPVIGTRSFSSDPHRVADFGVAFLQGLQAEQVLAFGKHFPGHGDTDIDSHLSLPIVSHNRARLEAVEFVPFNAAITAGVAGLMSAHVAFPAIDSGRTPATLSHRVLTRLLRQELGYGGLLATDSLEMGALSSTLGLSPSLAAAAALDAGADLLLFNRGHEQQREAHTLILKRVKDGEIPLSRLEEAVLRVLTAKAQFGLLKPDSIVVEAAATQVGTDAHRALAYDLVAQSITLLRDEARPANMPLTTDARPIVLETPALLGLGRLLGATSIIVNAQPATAEIQNLVGLARQRRPFIVGVSDIARQPAQADLVNGLLATDAPVILIATRDPYDLLAFPNAPSMLATYGMSAPTLRTLAAVLSGQAKPGGHLPVELPGLFGIGAGLGDFASQQ
jgi:beta-N-acetylhexosaminidase